MLLTISGLLLAFPAPGAPTTAYVRQDAAAAVETVESLVAEGRTALENGRFQDAETLFGRAHGLSGGAFETQVWVLRAWMELGRSNDTLDAIDALAGDGREGPAMDYLYGMAFARRAEQAVMSGGGDVSVGMNFSDAVRFLKSATEADPDRYRDAFLALATSAWYSQDLPLARTAADEAVHRYPKQGEANLMRGRIALSQFQLAQRDAGGPLPADWKGDVLAHWTVARDSFADAVTNFGTPKRNDQRNQNMKSQAAVQLGHAWIWKQARDEAARAYSTAIAWGPDRVNIFEIRSFLTDPENPNDQKLFLGALEDATKTFQGKFGKQDERNATLLWWLGYARYWGGKRPEAEEAYLACLELEPGYTNAWVYIGLARYDQKRYDEAIEAFRTGWDVDPVSVVNEVKQDQTGNANRLRFLIGHAFNAGDLERASFVAELVAEATETVSSDWNNLGLFLRDWAEARHRAAADGDTEELAQVEALYERAYTAYGRSLALTPNDPQVVNDTAVMLHYYLDRELDKAREMYVRAGELAMKELEKQNLSRDDRERFETAQRDARNNLRALEKTLEKRAGKGAGAGDDA